MVADNTGRLDIRALRGQAAQYLVFPENARDFFLVAETVLKTDRDRSIVVEQVLHAPSGVRVADRLALEEHNVGAVDG